MELAGIHHVSALTSQAERNFAFYTKTMGMRLLKRTVNQDDVASYHLFYGDRYGTPGADLTFFDIPGLAEGRPGSSSISTVGLRVRDRDALEYWLGRFQAQGVRHEGIGRLGEWEALRFFDFEGQRLALVADRDEGVAGGEPWERSSVPTSYGIRALGPVVLTVGVAEPTARVLQEIMGFRETGRYASSQPGQPDVLVFSTGAGGAGAQVHLEERGDLPRERLGRGGVHHVAFRVRTAEEQDAWLERLQRRNMRTSGIVDRFYFRSIYFREPNGILFELATDGPGFAVDEDPEHLGERLALPPFLEPDRARIEANLHPIHFAM